MGRLGDTTEWPTVTSGSEWTNTGKFPQTKGDNTATGFGYTAWPHRLARRRQHHLGTAECSGFNQISEFTDERTTRGAPCKNTCKTGFLWDYSDPTNPGKTKTAVADYAPIYSSPGVGAYAILTSFNIANEGRHDPVALDFRSPINLKITQNGLLSLSYSYNGGNFTPVISKQDITSSNGAGAEQAASGLDSPARRAGSTNSSQRSSASRPRRWIWRDLVGGGQRESRRPRSPAATQAFLAYYYPSNWTGRPDGQATSSMTPAPRRLFIASTANWDASCNLTGIAAGTSNACPTTGTVGPVAAQAPKTRTYVDVGWR